MVRTETRRLMPAGGLFDDTAQVVTCTTEGELLETFEWARTHEQPLTLLGSARSFGHHFHPPEDGLAVDVSHLGRGARVVERGEDGAIWIRAGGGTRFCDLVEPFPKWRMRCPPTSDRVTLAGALAGCVHNNSGYFADDVRAFRLVTPGGETYECSRQAPGLAGELYRAVPGAFGALGAVTEIELKLHPIEKERLLSVHAVYAGPSTDGKYLDVFEGVRDDPRYSEGAGAVVYGNRGHAIVFAHDQLPLEFEKDDKQALLTDDDIEQHAFTQGLANRFPRIAESTVRKTYPQGILRWAPWYGLHFFQRGYDRCYEVCGQNKLKHRLARLLGVDRRLPMIHGAWFFPRSELRAFMDTYFRVLDEFPGLEKHGEQQDLVLLGPCSWPAHSIGVTDQPVGVFTASYSVAALSDEKRERIVDFFQRVSRVTYERVPETRLSLSKQIHCDPQLLREMHQPWIDLIRPLRQRVDPGGMLTSRHLQALLGA